MSTEYFRKLLANGIKDLVENPILWTRRKDDFVKLWLSSDLSMAIIWIHLLRLEGISAEAGTKQRNKAKHGAWLDLCQYSVSKL